MDEKRFSEIVSGIKHLNKPNKFMLQSMSNPAFWVLDNLGKDLYDNQIEIITALCDLSVQNISILQARGAGKTFAVAMGLMKLCKDNRDFSVGIFAPKAKQAERIIDEITNKIATKKTLVYDMIDHKTSIKSRMRFKNGSEIYALSADETSQQEGYHFNMIIVDEAHRVTDTAMTQRVAPMIGTLKYAKTVKLGIAIGKNHFFRSCNSPSYKVFVRDWKNSPALLTAGSIYYKGKELPKIVVDRLPISIKQKLFPDRPDLHYESTEGYTELDYFTQYSMEWSDDIFLELNKENQEKLFSGTHDILNEARPAYNETYFFGLDTAPGSLTGNKDLDYTVLSIWRKLSNNVKEKVKCYSWQGNVVEQKTEIKQIITQIFPCMFGLADYSNIAQGTIEEWQKEGIAIEGVLFGSSEPLSKKNKKNAMFDQFRLELENDRVKFPSLETMNKDKAFKLSYNEWKNIERHIKLGINAQIEAPSGLHDDHPCADVLAVWAMDRMDQFKIAKRHNYRIPKPMLNEVSRIYNKHLNVGKRKENRYLK